MQQDKKRVGRPDKYGIGNMEVGQRIKVDLKIHEADKVRLSMWHYKKYGRKYISQTREERGKKFLHVWRKA